MSGVLPTERTLGSGLGKLEMASGERYIRKKCCDFEQGINGVGFGNC